MSQVSAQLQPRWSSFALIRLNAFSFGVTGFILAMDTAVLPVIVLSLAPESLKNTYLAMLGMGGLLVAAIMQPLIGRVSDHTRSPLGRRVPYIIFGITVVCASLVLLVLAPNWAALFGVWVFIQANLNIAYGPGMALIRDLVPRDRIGVASSVKILLDAVGGLVMITVSAALIGLGQRVGTELGPVPVYVDWEWAVLLMLGAALVVSVAVTCTTVLARDPRRRARPVRREEASPKRVLDPQLGLFLLSRLFLMTAIYAFPTYGLFFLRDVVEADNPAQTLSHMIPTIGGSLAVAVYAAGWVSDRNREKAGGHNWSRRGSDQHRMAAHGRHTFWGGGNCQRNRSFGRNPAQRQLGFGQRTGRRAAGRCPHRHRKPIHHRGSGAAEAVWPGN